jgi:hypothetical protein
MRMYPSATQQEFARAAGSNLGDFDDALDHQPVALDPAWVVSPPEADLRRRLSIGMSFIPNYDAIVSRSQSTAKHRNVGRLPSPAVVPPGSPAPQATPPPNSPYPVRMLPVPLVIQ